MRFLDINSHDEFTSTLTFDAFISIKKSWFRKWNEWKMERLKHFKYFKDRELFFSYLILEMSPKLLYILGSTKNHLLFKANRAFAR